MVGQKGAKHGQVPSAGYPLACHVCGKEFRSQNRRQKYCSPRCQMDAENKQQKERRRK